MWRPTAGFAAVVREGCGWRDGNQRLEEGLAGPLVEFMFDRLVEVNLSCGPVVAHREKGRSLIRAYEGLIRELWQIVRFSTTS